MPQSMMHVPRIYNIRQSSNADYSVDMYTGLYSSNIWEQKDTSK